MGAPAAALVLTLAGYQQSASESVNPPGATLDVIYFGLVSVPKVTQILSIGLPVLIWRLPAVQRSAIV